MATVPTRYKTRGARPPIPPGGGHAANNKVEQHTPHSPIQLTEVATESAEKTRVYQDTSSAVPSSGKVWETYRRNCLYESTRKTAECRFEGLGWPGGDGCFEASSRDSCQDSLTITKIRTP
ncbi:hypothetical protein Bbelb_349060 [Branchiostoma belcheri]|nr:hypothetical protein Bbelb_349060 [Branchiostoma belcheri]